MNRRGYSTDYFIGVLKFRGAWAVDERTNTTSHVIAEGFPSKHEALRWAVKRSRQVKRYVRGVQNPCSLKGRKVKGGRSVTLRNMASVTITRRGDGTVGIRGVKK